MVVTRFAPSPTGELHIGGARTALFNWLYAKHTGGKFLLRIEDTDRTRSEDKYTKSIQDQLSWLGLKWDGIMESQAARSDRHVEVANQLLSMGLAYKCYASKDDLDALRKEQEIKKIPFKYDGRWRDRNPDEAPTGVQPVIRLKSNQVGKTIINDLVQGQVTVDNSTLDDMILLRADGTPTYMLAVVVDDHDSGVTHVIRGDDHLNNAFRQLQIIKAMEWPEPIYAHIPLIHGEDGKRLSKRNVAPSITSYKDAGFLPNAVINYILRMGWGHGNDDIISINQAIDWFDVKDVSRAASRLDQAKLMFLNGEYMKNIPRNDAINMAVNLIEQDFGKCINTVGLWRLTYGFDQVFIRSKTIRQLADNLKFYADIKFTAPADSSNSLSDDHAKTIMKWLKHIGNCKEDWNHGNIESALRSCADHLNVKFSQIAVPLRYILTGMPVSPSLFEVINVLGYEETCRRISSVLK